MTRFHYPDLSQNGWPRVGLFATCLLLLLVAQRLFGHPMGGQTVDAEATPISGHANSRADASGSQPAGEAVRTYPVRINPVSPPDGVSTELSEYHGKSVKVACRTCHAIRPANPDNRQSSDLNEFHQNLRYQHGQQACIACHNADDNYQTLHLAAGTSIEYTDTMKLCAQCHGTQFRDYQHGSHGGMTGYWDLTRGPRQRNHCIDCHDPHAPSFPVVHPADGPRDRFSPASKDSHHE